MLRAYPERVHRLMISEADARLWIGEDVDAGAYAVARRCVTPWEIVDGAGASTPATSEEAK